MGAVYVARNSAAHATAVTILELTAGTGRPLRILGFGLTQSSSVTSTVQQLLLLRKTATVTGTAGTLIKLDPNSPTPAASVKHTATVEGTNGDTLMTVGFNILNGYEHYFLPEDRPIVGSAGMIAIKLGAAVNVTYDYWMMFEEI